jgi:hypothetical protein
MTLSASQAHTQTSGKNSEKYDPAYTSNVRLKAWKNTLHTRYYKSTMQSGYFPLIASMEDEPQCSVKVLPTVFWRTSFQTMGKASLHVQQHHSQLNLILLFPNAYLVP